MRAVWLFASPPFRGPATSRDLRHRRAVDQCGGFMTPFQIPLSRRRVDRHLSVMSVNPLSECPPLVPVVLSDEVAAKRAIEELFIRSRVRLGRYLLQMVRDRELAADLLQDTFHDALRFHRDFFSARNQEAWLFGVARHRALAALRRRGRFDRTLRRMMSLTAAQAEDDDVVAVYDLLERNLSAEDRALVVLRYLHGFETGLLAEIVGMTPDAVRQRLSRACARLRADTTSSLREGR